MLKIKIIITFVFMVMVVFIFSTPTFATIEITPTEGWQYYDPYNSYSDRANYRYGASIIINEEGSIDMWTSSGGKNGDADWITHTCSFDGGLTWGKENVVLRPTSGASDAISTCDPGVIKLGKYYYLGYTTTEDIRGTEGRVFVARSVSPSGPFEKWNGNGWGGNSPEALIKYDSAAYMFGAGEPSFVEKDGTLYIYYTWVGKDYQNKSIVETRVATAPSANENWPSQMSFRGTAIKRSISEDHSDVKYIDQYGKFVAISTAKRISADSYVNAWESSDGITFTPARYVMNSSMKNFIHNAGISSRANGHINLSDKNFIAYAYGPTWAAWCTFINPISFSNNSLPYAPESYYAVSENSQVKIYFEVYPGKTFKIKYGTTSGSYTNTINNVTSSPYTVTGLNNNTKYYFTVTSTDSNGESVLGNEVNATPKAFSKLTPTNTSASTQITGYEASKAVDGNTSTYWSSTLQASANNSQWITMDIGSKKNIGKVVLVPVQKSELYFPALLVQLSNDGSTWKNCDYTMERLDFVASTESKYIINFNKVQAARYVRIFGYTLGADPMGVSYCRIAEVEVYSLPNPLVPDENNFIDFSINYGSIIVIDGNTTASFQISANSSYANGTTQDITGSTGIIYSEYDPSIINISSTGQLIPRKKGTTCIKSVYQNKVKYTTVIVINKPADIPYTANASSYYGDFLPSKLIDGYQFTPWLSSFHNTQNEDEWVSIDFGVTKTLRSVQLLPRTDGVCFPTDFHLEYSSDGINWIDVPGATYTNQYDGSTIEKSYVLNSPVTARYLRVYITKLTNDGNGSYGAHISEVYINKRVIANASSYYSNFAPSNVLDGIQASPWLSQFYSDGPNHVEWISCTYDEEQVINTISLWPRTDGVCFPTDFHFEYSKDGVNWIDIPRQSYVNYQKQGSIGNERQLFRMINPIKTRFIRVYISKLTNDGGGGYGAHLGDLIINEEPKLPNSAEASSSIGTFYPSCAIDGQTGSCYISSGHQTENNTEWIKFEYNTEYTINSIVVLPRFTDNGVCFPKDFHFEYSIDGTNWEVIPGQTYSNYVKVGSIGNEKQVFKLNTPIKSKYLKLVATKLTDENGTYYLQIGDFYINGENEYNISLLMPMAISANASSYYDTFYPSSAADDNPYTCYISNYHLNEPFSTEWLSFEYSKEHLVDTIAIDPRSTDGGICFPEDFHFEYSYDGLDWIDIPNAQYVGYTKTGTTGTERQIFKLKSPIRTKYLRLVATKLTHDGTNNYFLMIGDLYIYEQTSIDKEIVLSPFQAGKILQTEVKIPLNVNRPQKLIVNSFTPSGTLNNIMSSPFTTITDFDSSIITVNSNNEISPVGYGTTMLNVNYKEMTIPIQITVDPSVIDVNWNTRCSSQIGGWESARVADKDYGSCWSSIWHNTSNATEWIEVSSTQPIIANGIIITPRSNGWFMPVDFSLEYSDDGVNWIAIPEHNYINYINPGNSNPITFSFSSPITSKYFRLVATKLADSESAGNFYLQISEMEILRTATVNEFTSRQSDITLKLSGDAKQIKTKVFTDENITKYLLTTADGVMYTGYNNSIINIDSFGVITPISIGATTVTVTYKGTTLTCNITVTQ